MIENPSSLAEHVSNLTECIAEDIKKLQTDTSKAVYTVNNVAPVGGNVDVDVPPSVHVGQTAPEDEEIVVWVDPDSSGTAVVKTVNNIQPDNKGNVVVDHVASTTKAVQDSEGNEITQTYVKKEFIGDQLIDYVALYDSIMNTVISAGGRKLYRHSSGMGTVIEFNDGQDRKVLVLDAQYRTKAMISSDITDVPELPNITVPGWDPNWINGVATMEDYTRIMYYNTGTVKSGPTSSPDSLEPSYPQDCESVTDSQLNELWPIDPNTSKYNTDVWLIQPDCEAALHCRSITVENNGCDIPNIQTLLRIYCEANNLDEMDPTLANYPDQGVAAYMVPVEGNVVAHSSTEGADIAQGGETIVPFCWLIMGPAGLVTGLFEGSRSVPGMIFPVLEL